MQTPDLPGEPTPLVPTPPSSNSEGASNLRPIPDAFQPYTTLVTLIITHPSQLLYPTTSPTNNGIPITDINHIYNFTVSSTVILQNPHAVPTRFVPSEADVPEAWQPKYIENEARAHTYVLAGMIGVFAAGVVGVLAISWCRCWWAGECLWEPMDEEEKIAKWRRKEMRTGFRWFG